MKILINLTTLGFSYVDLVNRQGHNYALVRLSNYSLITVICISLCELFFITVSLVPRPSHVLQR